MFLKNANQCIGIGVVHWSEIWAVHEGQELVQSAAGSSQKGVEVEDIAEVLKDSRRRRDPLELLVRIQETLFPRITFTIEKFTGNQVPKDESITIWSQ